MVLLRGATGVGQPTPENSQYLCFHGSRNLQPIPKKEKDLWKLYSEYGASPRNLFLHAKNLAQYEQFIQSEIRKLSPDSLIRLLQNTEAATDSSHYVITTGPLLGDRSKPYRTFTSPYALEGCYKLLLDDGANALRRLYEILRGDPTTSTATGMVFEHWAHQFLRKQKTMDLYPILGRLYNRGKKADAAIIYDDYHATKSGDDRKRINIQDLEEYVVIDETETAVEYNTYYHPKRTNFPTVDSWIVVRPHLSKFPIFMMFQITINTSSHDVNQAGLDIMDGLDVPKDALKWLVVVTPKELSPQIGPVETDYLKKKLPARARVNPDVHFPVFHYPIDTAEVYGMH